MWSGDCRFHSNGRVFQHNGIKKLIFQIWIINGIFVGPRFDESTPTEVEVRLNLRKHMKF